MQEGSPTEPKAGPDSLTIQERPGHCKRSPGRGGLRSSPVADGARLCLRWDALHEILLVEDNSDARETLRLLLELEGHRVAAAETGERAVHLASETAFTVALIDIGLPDIDGYEVARRIRSTAVGEQALLIALTGYGQPDDVKRAMAAGFNAHLVKPVDPDDLAKTLAELSPKAR
jgi:CheY-like chemotaxis protein